MTETNQYTVFKAKKKGIFILKKYCYIEELLTNILKFQLSFDVKEW